MAECDRLQLGECLATIGAAAEDQKLVADQLPAAAGEDGRSMGQARTVLLVAPGGEPSDAASVRGPGAADCWVASASGVIQALAAEKSIPSESRHAAVSEKNTLRSRGSVFSGPLEGQLGAAGTIRARNRKWKGPLGDECMYTRGRCKAKMETQVNNLQSNGLERGSAARFRNPG